jgi:hypothetical protein
MTDFPAVSGDAMPDDNHTPLPLLVAKRWHFPLATHQTDEGLYYSPHDWIKGLEGGDEVRKTWKKIQNRIPQLSLSKRQFPYKAQNSKTYKMDFVPDKGLYLIAQYLRVTEARPVLDEIRTFLAAAGAFVDEVRRSPDTVVLSGAMTPDQGKTDAWIRARLEGKIKRHQFTAALTAAVATDDIYKGLWGRTAAYLKEELELPRKASLRDHQPMLALHYLGQQQELQWNEARGIVQDVAQFIGRRASPYSSAAFNLRSMLPPSTAAMSS